MVPDQVSKLILVVDDEVAIRNVLRLTLARAGYEVAEAEDGPEALSMVQSERPDVVILDVMMPGMDGFEVCARLRANPDTARLPVVMLSAKTDPRSKQRGREVGATKYLTKPIAPQQLLAHLREVLEETLDAGAGIQTWPDKQ